MEREVLRFEQDMAYYESESIDMAKTILKLENEKKLEEEKKKSEEFEALKAEKIDLSVLRAKRIQALSISK